MNLTKDELYEINDAINEVVERMCTRGQTRLEIKHRSLANLWSVWPKVVEQVLGTTDTPGLRGIEPKVLENIRRPKILSDKAGVI